MEKADSVKTNKTWILTQFEMPPECPVETPVRSFDFFAMNQVVWSVPRSLASKVKNDNWQLVRWDQHSVS